MKLAIHLGLALAGALALVGKHAAAEQAELNALEALPVIIGDARGFLSF